MSADDEVMGEPFITVDLFAITRKDGRPGRGVVAGVHIVSVPPQITGPDVAQALQALAVALHDELGPAFRAILADSN